MRKDNVWRALFCVLVGWLAFGCGAPLTPVKTEVEAPSVARVQLLGIDDDIFKFVVYNLSDQDMVILRDEVVLVTPSGPRHRLPGGIDSVYNVAPKEHQPVNTRFDVSDVKTGDVLQVDFGPALQVGGKPTSIDPLPIRVD